MVQDANDVEACLKAGAVSAGQNDLIQRLLTGAIHSEEFDDIVCHVDLSPFLKKIRNIVGSRLPTSKNGRIGEDTVGMVKTFKESIEINSVPVPGVPEVNEMKVILGKLSWEEKDILDNLMAYNKAIEEASSKRILGNPIEAIKIYCPPIDERMEINVSILLNK
ncbi:unnamed protein product [Protopolystoma xenopodis]|uniref:Uncharacterized protein n=1 Tax=Protopolystoma xenopodis TaxID=117903 RepID=A0A3S5B2S9_9PLAT|nr:unnamed protein product [Protopolystoma xenopodis]